eukprot:scpid38628/ scgid4173/ 
MASAMRFGAILKCLSTASRCSSRGCGFPRVASVISWRRAASYDTSNFAGVLTDAIESGQTLLSVSELINGQDHLMLIPAIVQFADEVDNSQLLDLLAKCAGSTGKRFDEDKLQKLRPLLTGSYVQSRKFTLNQLLELGSCLSYASLLDSDLMVYLQNELAAENISVEDLNVTQLERITVLLAPNTRWGGEAQQIPPRFHQLMTAVKSKYMALIGTHVQSDFECWRMGNQLWAAGLLSKSESAMVDGHLAKALSESSLPLGVLRLYIIEASASATLGIGGKMLQALLLKRGHTFSAAYLSGTVRLMTFHNALNDDVMRALHKILSQRPLVLAKKTPSALVSDTSRESTSETSAEEPSMCIDTVGSESSLPSSADTTSRDSFSTKGEMILRLEQVYILLCMLAQPATKQIRSSAEVARLFFSCDWIEEYPQWNTVTVCRLLDVLVHYSKPGHHQALMENLVENLVSRDPSAFAENDLVSLLRLGITLDYTQQQLARQLYAFAHSSEFNFSNAGVKHAQAISRSLAQIRYPLQGAVEICIDLLTGKSWVSLIFFLHIVRNLCVAGVRTASLDRMRPVLRRQLDLLPPSTSDLSKLPPATIVDCAWISYVLDVDPPENLIKLALSSSVAERLPLICLERLLLVSSLSGVATKGQLVMSTEVHELVVRRSKTEEGRDPYHVHHIVSVIRTKLAHLLSPGALRSQVFAPHRQFVQIALLLDSEGRPTDWPSELGDVDTIDAGQLVQDGLRPMAIVVASNKQCCDDLGLQGGDEERPPRALLRMQVAALQASGWDTLLLRWPLFAESPSRLSYLISLFDAKGVVLPGRERASYNRQEKGASGKRRNKKAAAASQVVDQHHPWQQKQRSADRSASGTPGTSVVDTQDLVTDKGSQRGLKRKTVKGSGIPPLVGAMPVQSVQKRTTAAEVNPGKQAPSDNFVFGQD